MSPEGARLGVVKGTTLEVYELPEMLTGTARASWRQRRRSRR